ncbi:hypothetical protein ACFX2B_008642 [Malus domestica]
MTSFESSLIEDGDIICFQKSTPLEIEEVSLSLHSVLGGDLQVKRSHPNAELRCLRFSITRYTRVGKFLLHESSVLGWSTKNMPGMQAR